VQAAVQWTEMALPISVGSAHLALRQCQPRAAAPLAQVVVAGAMGVQQSYYQAFARWLAEQGYGVTTFDYRGHGLSLQVPLRDARADLLDWAKDCELVAAQLKQQFPEQPLIWIGHSVGSQLPGLASIPLPINGLLSVGSGSGYWRDNAAPTRRMIRLFWWGVARWSRLCTARFRTQAGHCGRSAGRRDLAMASLVPESSVRHGGGGALGGRGLCGSPLPLACAVFRGRRNDVAGQRASAGGLVQKCAQHAGACGPGLAPPDA
jgi:pimeloyl-ACP methyl ester carboxylesterase